MDKLSIFHSLVNLAAADNKFTDEEVRFLLERAEQWNIPTSEFETALAGLSEGTIEVNIPESHNNRVILLKDMVRLMAVDGHLANMEKHLCATASGKMDLTSEQFTEILDEVLGLDKK